LRFTDPFVRVNEPATNPSDFVVVKERATGFGHPIKFVENGNLLGLIFSLVFAITNTFVNDFIHQPTFIPLALVVRW